MKQIVVVFRVFLLMTVFASLAACSGGIFVDPGHGAGGGSGNGGGGSVSKPSKLSNDASYSQAAAKLDEIITYCDAHPGMTNNTIKSSAQLLKSTISSYQSWWSSMAGSLITEINTYIDALE
jgi:hypothetical protein